MRAANGYPVDSTGYAQYYGQYYQQSAAVSPAQTATEAPPGYSAPPATATYYSAPQGYQQYPYTTTPGYNWNAYYAGGYAAHPANTSGVTTNSGMTSQTQPVASTQPARVSYSDVAKIHSTHTVSTSSPAYQPPKANLTKPAYIPLKPRKILSESPLAQQSADDATSSASAQAAKQKQLNDPTKWPPSLKEYVSKVFDTCPSNKRDMAEKQMKDLITRTIQSGAMWTTDWEGMALPDYCVVTKPPNGVEPMLVSEESPTTTPKMKSKKRKQQHDTSTLKAKSSPKPVSSTAAKSSPNIGSADEVTTSVVDSDDSLLSRLPPALRAAEINRRQQRALRFQSSAEIERQKALQSITAQKAREEFLKAGAEGNPDVVDWDEHTIIGTSQQLEKRYLRLTSAPDPSTVRPLMILERALEFVCDRWKQERNYAYVCDQLKSIRQDLTVQRIKNAFSVTVYERHGRIALEMNDLGEFNQCQSQLMMLYELGLGTSEGRDEYLYLGAPRMSGYLMDTFLERVRVSGMRVVCRGYRPSMRVDWIAKEFGWVGDEGDKLRGEEECRKWLDRAGVVWDEEPTVPGTVIAKGKKAKHRRVVKNIIKCKESLPAFIRMEEETRRKGVDIKGQI
ncbi:hypothetical protein HDU85_006740 [Gaertneriomyces sp. JEL0708]|nr:hypothetical protein HDU85_006740 [Gaertneriomyces sp. JEL0708]